MSPYLGLVTAAGDEETGVERHAGNFLRKAGFTPVRRWVRPRPLAKGETIGIAAPSGWVGGIRDKVEGGIAVIEAMGYQVKRGRHLYDEWMGLAGPHAARLEDWNGMLRDPDVRMVMAATGGSGCLAIVDGLDFAAFAEDPKWVSGMSDLTIFLNALSWRTGVETLHGPDVAFSFGVEHRREFEAPLFQRFMSVDGLRGPLPLGDVRVLRPGTANGRLFGGTLSVLGYLMATPWAPDLTDAILVLEGWSLGTATVHRWLQVLRMQGKLAQLRAMVLGNWSGCFQGESDPGAALTALVLDACAGTDFPIIQVDRIGHDTVNVPWPVGALAEVSESGITLT